MDLLNAQLELRFELIRSITPRYSEYKYTMAPFFERATSDGSVVTAALKKASKTAKKWTYVDLDAAASRGSFSRAEAVQKLQQWNDCGAVVLQPSGVVNRFRILKEFPRDETAQADIIKGAYDYIEAREKSDIERVKVSGVCSTNMLPHQHLLDRSRKRMSFLAIL